MVVQLAKLANATVTGACSRGNFDLVLRLGCDEVIDYTSGDAVGRLTEYDLVVDAVGHSKTSALKVASKRALAAGGDMSRSMMTCPPRRRRTSSGFGGSQHRVN